MSRTADRIVWRIIDDLSDRKALQQAWEQIDDLTQYEIAERWKLIVDEERA